MKEYNVEDMIFITDQIRDDLNAIFKYMQKIYLDRNFPANLEEDADPEISDDIVDTAHELTDQLFKALESLKVDENKIKTAQAIYTGGGVWLFIGELENGNYFLTANEGYTLILDEDPEDLDKSLEADWQEKHTIKDIGINESFIDDLMDYMKENGKQYGFTEPEYYRNYMKIEY